MADRRRRAARWLTIAVVTVALCGLFVWVAGSYAGTFLVLDQRFDTADIALVLSGDPVVRTLAARDLFREARVRRIVVIPEPPRGARIEAAMATLNLADSRISIAEQILIASGVPASAVAFLPEPADGTIVEARRVKQFLKGAPAPRRIALVSSKFSSRRACFIFRQVLKDVEIVCAPSSYDAFDAHVWWKPPRNALNVVMEYQKFIANVLTLMLRPARD
jgi:uncharacterized SAM-binding protein YcdF (DUF218 family)